MAASHPNSISRFLPMLITFAALTFAFSTSALSWRHPTCLGCRIAVRALRFLYEQNATSSEILYLANLICRHYAHQEAFVCHEITSQFKDEFLYVLGQLVFRPNQLCGLLIGGCGTPVNPFDTNWTVPLPPKVNPDGANPVKNSAPSNQQPPLRILQLSDIHFDPAYLEGSEAECPEPVCCLERVENPKQKAGYWGSAGKCDIPLRTLENMLQHINQTHQIDFALLSGDYVDHRDWAYFRPNHLAAIANISTFLQRHLPQVPVFWTLGNHEGVPVNSFAPHFVPERFRPEWIYRAVLEAGHKTAPGKLPPTVDESAIYRGSYAVNLSDQLKLISLNNGYCEKTNMFIYINQTDPDGSLTWLVEQLWEAEKAGQAVFILAHIPPGDNECLESWSRNYYRIVVRFADSIRLQFFGHTHFDSFSMFFADMNDPNSPPVSMLFTAPSVTTFEGLNPAYRIYTVDQSTLQLLDYETYFLNLSAIAHNNATKPNWELLYSAKSEYGLKDMSVQEWNALAAKIETDPEVAAKFNRNFVRRTDMPCDANCLADRVCAIKAAHHNRKELCAKTENGENNRSKKLAARRANRTKWV